MWSFSSALVSVAGEAEEVAGVVHEFVSACGVAAEHEVAPSSTPMK